MIVLQENNNGSTAETFREMIEASGLQIVFVNSEVPQRTSGPSLLLYRHHAQRRDAAGLGEGLGLSRNQPLPAAAHQQPERDPAFSTFHRMPCAKAAR